MRYFDMSKKTINKSYVYGKYEDKLLKEKTLKLDYVNIVNRLSH